ncbi:MAG: hypothetical protein RL230_1129 [Pseudomonadota bacterium]|jgi:hypothetical protein
MGSLQPFEDKTLKGTSQALNSLTVLLRVFLRGLLGTHQDVPKPGLKRLTHLLKPLMAKAAIFAHIGEAFARRMEGKA